MVFRSLEKPVHPPHVSEVYQLTLKWFLPLTDGGPFLSFQGQMLPLSYACRLQVISVMPALALCQQIVF